VRRARPLVHRICATGAPASRPARGNVRGNIQIVHYVQYVQIRGRFGRYGRIGRIGHLGYQVEGLVRDNRVEVRVLFGASRITCSARRFPFPVLPGGGASGDSGRWQRSLHHRVPQAADERARANSLSSDAGSMPLTSRLAAAEFTTTGPPNCVALACPGSWTICACSRPPGGWLDPSASPACASRHRSPMPGGLK
jgi:hypothetical protein